jgi:hypothetical protein
VPNIVGFISGKDFGDDGGLFYVILECGKKLEQW